MTDIIKVKHPHERCNYILKNVIIGACPMKEKKTLEKMIEFGITIFVDMREKCDYNVPHDIMLYHFPTKSGKPPSKKNAQKILNLVFENKDKLIYIHCSGGHGRAGTIGAYIVGKINNLDCSEAIEYIEKARETREDKTKNFIPTPEMTAQVTFLFKELGLKEGNILPNRSNLSWLKMNHS